VDKKETKREQRKITGKTEEDLNHLKVCYLSNTFSESGKVNGRKLPCAETKSQGTSEKVSQRSTPPGEKNEAAGERKEGRHFQGRMPQISNFQQIRTSSCGGGKRRGEDLR